jgi:hypothetical protein
LVKEFHEPLPLQPSHSPKRKRYDSLNSWSLISRFLIGGCSFMIGSIPYNRRHQHDDLSMVNIICENQKTNQPKASVDSEPKSTPIFTNLG